MTHSRTVFTLVVLLASIAVTSCATAGPKATDMPVRAAVYNFKGSNGWQKLDLVMQQDWLAAMEGGQRDQQMQCMIKVSHPPSQKQLDKLASRGFNNRAVAGTVLTGSVAANNLPGVAELAFVDVIEHAIPLSQKPKGWKALEPQTH